jgi:hypothetical protein
LRTKAYRTIALSGSSVDTRSQEARKVEAGGAEFYDRI